MKLLRCRYAGRAALALAVAIPLLAAGLAGPRTAAQVQPRLNDQPLAADRGAAGLYQALLRLRTRASLLMLTAHPDDEDGGMLAYEARGVGARVILLTLTRGEGGQNVVSPDYWDALGLVRTQELLAADRYYGAEQYWSRATDFGFSKTRDETLSKWGHDTVLYDAVRVVRMTRPLVLTSVWVGGPSDGHGHHEVAGELAQEVYQLAGDPSVFPDQIQAGLRPWTPLKVYARVPFFSVSRQGLYDYATRTYGPVGVYNYVAKRWEAGVPSTTIEIPEGRYDPLMGLSYLQWSRRGLAQQKTQNDDVGSPPAGRRMSAYHRFASRVTAPGKEATFFDGIDTSLPGIASLAPPDDAAGLRQLLAPVAAAVEEALRNFSAAHPAALAPALAQGLTRLNAAVNQVEKGALPQPAKDDVLFELRQKQADFQKALALALGVTVSADVAPAKEPRGPFAAFAGPAETFRIANPSQQFSVNVHVNNASAEAVEIRSVRLQPARGDWKVQALPPPPAAAGKNTAGSDGKSTPIGFPASLSGNQPLDFRFSVQVPADAAWTRPYFGRASIEQPVYKLLDARYQCLSFAPYPLNAWVELQYHGVPVQVAEVVQTVKRLPGLGPVAQPLVVGPPISVAIAPRSGIIPLGARSFQVSARVRNLRQGPASGTLRLQAPSGWRITPAQAPFTLEREGEEQGQTFRVFCPALKARAYRVQALAEFNGEEYRDTFQAVGYPGLRPSYQALPAVQQTRGVAVKVPAGLRVGYVAGTGDDIPPSLENFGIHAVMLSSADLASGDLRRFDTIILGIRAYSVREDLKNTNSRLLDFVRRGGALVVQYNAPDFNHNYGPFPYDLSGNPEIVVDETSPVKILDAKSPAMLWPNRISAKDFDGWVEERGHGFMKAWDSHYDALLETHDPGQPPQRGGLLMARYGKGAYVYAALAFYRQLPEGVPGAYRLFANLLSLSRNPALRAPAPQAAGSRGSAKPKPAGEPATQRR